MDAGVCDCNVGVQLRVPQYVLKKRIFRFGFRALVRGVIVRLKIVAVLESGDATLALKNCSHPPIVRD